MNEQPGFYRTGLLRHLFFLLLLLPVLAAVDHTAHAYQLLGVKWPDPSTTFHVDIPGEGGMWNQTFESAMYEWSSATEFQYYISRGSYSDPCDSEDERNGVRFSSDNCGEGWGSTTWRYVNTGMPDLRWWKRILFLTQPNPGMYIQAPGRPEWATSPASQSMNWDMPWA